MKLVLAFLCVALFLGCSDADETDLQSEWVSETDLEGQWVFEYWEDLDSGRREYPPSIAPAVSINFMSLRNLTGLGPCNLYSGQFTVSPGNELSVHSLLSTDRACAEDTLNSWELRYFDSLSQVNRYETRPNQLRLYIGKQVRAMVFRLLRSAEP